MEMIIRNILVIFRICVPDEMLQSKYEFSDTVQVMTSPMSSVKENSITLDPTSRVSSMQTGDDWIKVGTVPADHIKIKYIQFKTNENKFITYQYNNSIFTFPMLSPSI